MKILGEKSLSSKVIIGLIILFIIISIIDIFVLSTIIKVSSHIIMKENIQSNVFDLILFAMIIITGIIALFIIYQFIQIFKNLKNNILFCENNAQRLNIVSNSCFIISAVYFIIAILFLLIMSDMAEEFMYYIFAFIIMLTIIFAVSGIGIKILNEIYKKAIEYKEENDFTI
jgi:hypothetical protein